MKKSISFWQIIGFVFTSAGGVLLHFLYNISGESLWVAPFSAINESTWEHMKILFVPMFLFAVVQSFFFKEYENFWCVKLKGILLGLTLIPVIFYTYNGVIGKSPDWINIAIFFVTAATVYIYETKLFKRERTQCNSPKLACFALCTIALLFVIFTFSTPQIGIFMDPTTRTYGLN